MVRVHRRLGRGGCVAVWVCAGVQHTRNFLHEFVRLQRLGRKAIHARFIGGAAVLLQNAGRQRNDGDGCVRVCSFPGADGARSFQPIHVGHLQVHQDEIKHLRLTQMHGFQPVVRKVHRVAVAAHDYLQQFQVLRHIVHTQNVQRRQWRNAGGHHALGRFPD